MTFDTGQDTGPQDEGGGPDAAGTATATSTAAANQPTGYASEFGTYHRLGWRSALPLPRSAKNSPPPGYTGRGGIDPSYADMLTWADSDRYRGGNLCLRLPPDVIGIDTDDYGGKNGGATIAEGERRWGRLPFSPRSTARHNGDYVSGIRLYRIPEGVELRDRIEFAELGLGGVEVIQHHHRYVVCWPSRHPNGDVYLWLGIDDGMLEDPPGVADIPDLPEPWLQALTVDPPREPVCNGDELGPESTAMVRECLTEGQPSHRVAVKLGEALTELYGPSCRHDQIRNHVLGLLRCGKNGEPGVRRALNALSQVFVTEVGPDRPGGQAQALGEFKKFINETNRVAALLADESYDDDVSAAVTTSSTGRVVTLVPLTDVKDTAARWIWEYGDAGRVERGVLSLFAGRPGSGKSTGARWFTGELSKGTLDGCWKGDPQKVAYISAEESDEGVKAGYRAAGVDMARIFLPKVTLDGKAVGLLSRTDEHALTEELRAAGIAILVVDPLMSTINGKTDLNRNNEIREVLEPWVRIAQAIDGAVIGIVHFKKPNGNGGDDVVSMVTGSSAFGEVARCIFGFAKNPEDDTTRILQQVKNNRGREDLCLKYNLDEVAITTDSGEQTTASRFTLGGPSDTTVGEALRSGTTQGGRPLGAKALQIVEFVNGRVGTSSQDLEQAGLVKDRAEGNTLLHRLYRRKFIDTSVWGIYHPVGTEPQ